MSVTLVLTKADMTANATQETYTNVGLTGVAPTPSAFNPVTKTANYNAVAGDMVLCDTSGGGFTVTLPLSAANEGLSIIIKKTSSDSNTLTIACSGSDHIDGASSQSTAIQNTAVTSTADGTTNWEIV